MTDLEKNTEVAKALGWKEIFIYPRGFANGRPSNKQKGLEIVPNYITDLNATHEMEKFVMADKAHGWRYWDVLCVVCGMSFPLKEVNLDDLIKLGHATAAQRVEAFLRTKGLWQE